MPRAVIYVRVSTKEQVQNMSLSIQREQCRDWCERNGYDVDRVFEDAGESAKTIDRPEFLRMVDYCRSSKGRVQAVVVYSGSRFARNLDDHVSMRVVLGTHGVKLRSATEAYSDDPDGRLIENISAVLAEHDNNVKARRTRVGMERALREGRWTFQPPLGYLRQGIRRASTLIPDPARAPIVIEAFRLFATGTLTKKRTLTKLTALGLKTAKGRPLGAQAFERLLRNPIYAGRLTVAAWDVDVEADFAPLITAEMFNLVQARLDGRRTTARPHLRSHPDFPLRHFTRCGCCGKPLTASWSRSRQGNRYGYYRCPGKGCGKVSVRREQLHQEFVRFVECRQPHVEFVQLFRAIVEDVWRNRHKGAAAQARRLEDRLADLKARKARLVDAVADQLLRKDEGRERLDAVEAEAALVQRELGEAREEELDLESVLGFAERFLSQAAGLWNDASHAHRERLQGSIFPAGVTFSDAGFETSATSLMFSELRDSEAEKLQLASPTGFEPPPATLPEFSSSGSSRT